MKKNSRKKHRRKSARAGRPQSEQIDAGEVILNDGDEIYLIPSTKVSAEKWSQIVEAAKARSSEKAANDISGRTIRLSRL